MLYEFPWEEQQKKKNKQIGLHQTENILHSKRNHQRHERTTY